MQTKLLLYQTAMGFTTKHKSLKINNSNKWIIKILSVYFLLSKI